MKISVRMKRVYLRSGDIFIWGISINGTSMRSDWVEIKLFIMRSKSQATYVSGAYENPGPRLFQSRVPDVDSDVHSGPWSVKLVLHTVCVLTLVYNSLAFPSEDYNQRTQIYFQQHTGSLGEWEKGPILWGLSLMDYWAEHGLDFCPNSPPSDTLLIYSPTCTTILTHTGQWQWPYVPPSKSPGKLGESFHPCTYNCSQTLTNQIWVEDRVLLKQMQHWWELLNFNWNLFHSFLR